MRWKSYTHAHMCYIKALLQKWLLCSSFSTREIKNRNVHALWMYFPSRKCAVVGVRHWLHTIMWHLLPWLPLAGTCGALWGKAFLTGPRSPEELLETGRRTMSVEPGEQWVGLRDGIAMDMSVEVLGCDLPLQKRTGIYRDDHMAQEVQRERTMIWKQWHSESMCHVHISSADT